MLIELFESVFYSIWITLSILCVFVVLFLLGFIKKWKWYYYLILIGILISIFPIQLLGIYKIYVYERYNYHVSGSTADVLAITLSKNGRIPMIIPGSVEIEVWHSMSSWSARCRARLAEWNNIYGVWAEKFDLRKIEGYKIDQNDLDVFHGISLDNFTWNEKYETPTATNGSRLIILRNSKNGECCLYQNRW